MIVKKTKQLGNFKKGINLYVPRRSSASRVPTTLPISTPTLYFSGLTFASDYGGGNSFAFRNPYQINSPSLEWRGQNYEDFFSNLSYSVVYNEWGLYVGCYNSDDGQPTNIQCARNLANGAAIPLTGWTYQSGPVVGGTLVISTTP
jgi:hypothetical protein